MPNNYDTIIIGGGLVGAAISVGVVKRGGSVLILDGEDRDFRASRGNFGLIWVQGKGANFAPYARLSGLAANTWPQFGRELCDATGIDIGLRQNGGYDFCLEQADWDARSLEMDRVRQHTNGNFSYEMLENSELRQRIPQVSKSIIGASYSRHDGHVNPLILLRALHRRMQDLGCDYIASRKVVELSPQGVNVKVRTPVRDYCCARVILCAGLDNQRLGKMLDLRVPVSPLRGQLLITERVDAFLPCASLQVRQTVEGSLQIGDSHESVGLDDAATLEVITRLATRAVKIFPHLAGVKLVRAWGALRVMTPDGVPIYHRSARYPGASAISCHSGVTLAPLHAGIVADWLCDHGQDADHADLIAAFSGDRFDVSPVA